MKSWIEFCGATIAGRYRLAEQVTGVGSLGAVYAATDSDSGQRVAVKLLHASLGSSGDFDEECLFCEHPGFVRVRDAGLVDDEYPFIVMDLIEAQQLSGPLTPLEAGQILAGVATALQAAYARLELNHLNLNPRNILLRSGVSLREPLIADFGQAAQIGAASVLIESVRNGIVGPEYLSPEQLRGQGPSPQSDVYSMGVILFELLTGQLPFTADGSSLDAFLQHLDTASPPRISDLVPDLAVESFVEATILRCLSLNPASRPESVAELEELIGPPLAGRTGDTMAPVVPSEPESFCVEPEAADHSLTERSDDGTMAPSDDRQAGDDQAGLDAFSDRSVAVDDDANTQQTLTDPSEYDPWAGLGEPTEVADERDEITHPDDGTATVVDRTESHANATDAAATMMPTASPPEPPPSVEKKPPATPPSRTDASAPVSAARPTPSGNAMPDGATVLPGSAPAGRTPVSASAPIPSAKAPAGPSQPAAGPPDGTLMPGGPAAAAVPENEDFPAQPVTTGEDSSDIGAVRTKQRPPRSGVPKAVGLLIAGIALLTVGTGGFVLLQRSSLTDTALELARQGEYGKAMATIDGADPLTALILSRSDVEADVFKLGQDNINKLISGGAGERTKAISHVDQLATSVTGRDDEIKTLRRSIAEPVLEEFRGLQAAGSYDQALALLDQPTVTGLAMAAPDVLNVPELKASLHDGLVADLQKKLDQGNYSEVDRQKTLRFQFPDSQRLRDILERAGFQQDVAELQSLSQQGQHSLAVPQSNELVERWTDSSLERQARLARVKTVQAAGDAALSNKDTGAALSHWSVALSDLHWLRDNNPDDATRDRLCQQYLSRAQVYLDQADTSLDVATAQAGLEDFKAVLSIDPDHAECKARTANLADERDRLFEQSTEKLLSADITADQLQAAAEAAYYHATIAVRTPTEEVPKRHYLRAIACKFLAGFRDPPTADELYRQAAEEFISSLQRSRVFPDARPEHTWQAQALYELAEILVAGPNDIPQQGYEPFKAATTAESFLKLEAPESYDNLNDTDQRALRRLIAAREVIAVIWANKENDFYEAENYSRDHILGVLNDSDPFHLRLCGTTLDRIKVYYQQEKPFRLVKQP